mgnify:CR=1 FL=1
MNRLPPASENTESRQAHPYAGLTPDVVLDALASVGLLGDGRLTALSSYENRVYQIYLEDPHAGHGAVVAKFYRPERWSDAQILEEHTFATELAAQEVPVVAPLLLDGATLHHFGGFAFSVSPWRGGRAPELDDFEVLEWVAGSWRASTPSVRPVPSPRDRRWTFRHLPWNRATGCCLTR